MAGYVMLYRHFQDWWPYSFLKAHDSLYKLGGSQAEEIRDTDREMKIMMNIFGDENLLLFFYILISYYRNWYLSYTHKENKISDFFLKDL